MRPKPINALELGFGEPLVIISTLVLALPPVKADSMNKLVDFALAVVQTLYSTIDTCGLKEYRRDVTVLQDLVRILALTIKLDWARNHRKREKVNLVTFIN